MRRRWRCAASRWRSSAISRRPRHCFADAARGFGAKEPLARARCVVAQAEVALASRDLGFPAKTLDAARAALEAHGDRANAAHARFLEVRRLLLIGRLDGRGARADAGSRRELPPSLRAAHELVIAGIAIRRIRTNDARAALMRAERAARDAGIPALWAEVDSALRVLNTMAARRIAKGEDKPLTPRRSGSAAGVQGVGRRCMPARPFAAPAP